ncbi:MAG: cytochrome-c peroxidase [Salibacteraceae bacterium]
MKKISVILFGIILLVTSCKKDNDEEDCEPTGPEYKRTEYTLQPPAYFPPFPQQIILTEEIVSLGRSLFYEKKLSGDGTQSCASCHNQAYGFSDYGNQFSEGIDGLKGDMNAMAIINLNWANGFFWNGRSATLEIQAIEPVINPIEMHNTWESAINTLKGDSFYIAKFYEAFGTNDWDSTHAAEAIAQFEKTLLSGNSVYDEYNAIWEQNGGAQIVWPSPEVQRGYRIFTSEPKSVSGVAGGDCYHCHSVDNLLFTNNEFMNNGLDVNPKQGLADVTGLSTDIGKFKVPTLRNVEKTGPYMHDGRFQTLKDVVNYYNSGVNANSPNIASIMEDSGGGVGIADGLNLTDDEKDDLIAFLKSLTDNQFLTNPDFSDPNK